MSNNINTDNMLRVGTVLHGTYRIDRYLSSGGFGNTYVATNIQFREQYAIKEFFMRGISQRDNNNTTVSVSNTDNRETFASQLEKFKKEARRLRKLNNEHIVRVHDLFEENGTAYYVMDYIDGENLSDRLKRTGNPLSEAEVMQLLPQILDALEAAHKEGILHLDLKPANIMVDRQGVVKLIDFGASKQQSAQGGATTSTAVSYTNGYAPREQMEQNLEKFGPWTDFYALGATLYTLLTNKKPPLPSDIDDDGSEDKHFALPMPANSSEKLRKLVLWLMNTNKNRRPQNIEEIKEYLSNSLKVDNANFDSKSNSQTPSKNDEFILTKDDSTKLVASDKQIRKKTAPANKSTRKSRQYYIRRKKQRTVVIASIIIAAILLVIFASKIGHSDNRTASTATVDTDTVVSNKLPVVKMDGYKEKIINRPSKKNANIDTVNMKTGIYYLCVSENLNWDYARFFCKDLKRKGYDAKLVINPKYPTFCHVCVYETASYREAKAFYNHFSCNKYRIAFPFYNGKLLGPNDFR